MKPHPRIRKTVKWGGLSLSVLLTAAWIGSAFCCFWFVHWGVNVLVDSGQFMPSYLPGADHAYGQWVVWETHAPRLHWWFERIDAGYAKFLVVPMWAPTLLTLACTAAAWRMDILARRRDRLGYCRCGYDRRGLPSPDAPCPECGGAP